MGDTQFHFRIRCSPRSCHKSRLVSQYENEVPLSYRVCVVDSFCKTTVPRSYRAVKKFLSRRLVMNSRQLWNSHQRHKLLRGEASRDILKFRVSEMAFSGVFKRYFPPQTPCFFVRIHSRLGIMLGIMSQAFHDIARFERFIDLNLFKCAFNCNVIQNQEIRCFIALFDGAYFLLAVMVERDESSRLRMAN